MRPLIPRVRPGDILKGTRNLRNWLQTASVLNYLTHIRHGEYGGSEEAKKKLYTPSKDDEFIVTVNAWGMFGAYSRNKDVILLFRNCQPQKSPSSSPTASKKPIISTELGCTGVRHNPARKHKWEGDSGVRMNPTLFSQWFIRTNGKCLELDTWPRYAIHMWSSLHLNLCVIPSSIGNQSFGFHTYNGPAGPFEMHDNGSHSELLPLTQAFAHWYPRGITRMGGKYSFALTRPSGIVGPHLAEIPTMRWEIQELCSNPRVRARIKKDKGKDWSAFLQTYLVNDS